MNWMSRLKKIEPEPVPQDAGNFDADVDRVVSELNTIWARDHIEMDQIPIEARRRALELDAEMTQRANDGDLQAAKVALREWCGCWMPQGSDAEREYCITERAAIMEFDGGLPREEAEAVARDRLMRE